MSDEDAFGQRLVVILAAQDCTAYYLSTKKQTLETERHTAY